MASLHLQLVYIPGSIVRIASNFKRAHVFESNQLPSYNLTHISGTIPLSAKLCRYMFLMHARLRSKVGAIPAAQNSNLSTAAFMSTNLHSAQATPEAENIDVGNIHDKHAHTHTRPASPRPVYPAILFSVDVHHLLRITIAATDERPITSPLRLCAPCGKTPYQGQLGYTLVLRLQRGIDTRHDIRTWVHTASWEELRMRRGAPGLLGVLPSKQVDVRTTGLESCCTELNRCPQIAPR